MSRTVTAAAVRLCNDPAPTADRLRAAETQIAAAAKQGAELIVLPEVFNTGYEYNDANYGRAERMDGPTVTWMKRIAAEYGIHLAGSLLLLGPEHITNSLLLVAPDGRFWRYDKNHPWIWERAYFREGTDITIAETDLGTFGLMICADVLWPRLFERYAGKVDALVISASPPRIHEAVLHFPGGDQATLAELMRFPNKLSEEVNCAFGANVCGFAQWLGVPVVQTTAYGHFSTYLPGPRLTFTVMLATHPSRWHYWLQANKIRMTTDYFAESQIIDSQGMVVARYDDAADGFALDTIVLANSYPVPRSRMPTSLRMIQIAGWLSDSLGWLLIPTYRRGVRKAWKHQLVTAPIDLKTRIWGVIMVMVGVLVYLAGRFDRWNSGSLG